MSMSTGVIGLRDMDGEFKRMLDMVRYCREHHFTYPQEVQDFFQHRLNTLDDYEDEGESEESAWKEWVEDVTEDMLDVDLGAAVREYQSESGDASGVEIDVAHIPKEVKTLRFYNSW